MCDRPFWRNTLVMVAAATAACAQPKTSHDAVSAAPLPSLEIGGQSPHVEDPSGRLTSEQRAALLARIAHLASAGNPVAVLIAPTLKGETIEQLAERRFSGLHLGDHGVLVVLAMEEHRSRIETGKAVEGTLTDDRCGQVLHDNLRPHLQRGEVYEGLGETLDAISGILQHGSDAGS
jgi:uncharacterized protein